MSQLTRNTIDAAGVVVTKIINDARVTNVTTDTHYRCCRSGGDKSNQ